VTTKQTVLLGAAAVAAYVLYRARSVAPSKLSAGAMARYMKLGLGSGVAGATGVDNGDPTNAKETLDLLDPGGGALVAAARAAAARVAAARAAAAAGRRTVAQVVWTHPSRTSDPLRDHRTSGRVRLPMDPLRDQRTSTAPPSDAPPIDHRTK
jgi:hypothetical protein